MDRGEGCGGVYLAMMWCGTIELIGFGGLYLLYTWWVA